MESKIENTNIKYKGKEVTAKKLTVSSRLSIDIEVAWAKVQTAELLVYVTEGKVKFKPVDGVFPKVYKEGMTVSTRMLVYGFIPFGGIHTIYLDKIDSGNHILQTKEADSVTKVWNHKITMTKIDDTHIEYEDEIIIYAGVLTSVIVWWAKSFYEYRQRRWLLIADKHRMGLTQ